MGRTPDLRDRHVIVTGGSSGIGLALVLRLQALGAKVSVVAIDDGDLARLRAEQPKGATLSAPADVSDRAQARGGRLGDRGATARSTCW